METDYDIYEDLPNIDISTYEENEKLKQQNALFKDLIRSLEADVDKLCARISERKKKEDNLAKNISELYKTAKAEIERKDRTIAGLRSQVEKLQFEKRNHTVGVKRERSDSSHRSSSDFMVKKVKSERRSRSPSPRSRSRSRSSERHQWRRSKTRDRLKNGRIKNETSNSSAVQTVKVKSESPSPRRRSRSRSRERHQRKRSKTRDRLKNGGIKNGTLNSSAVQTVKVKSESPSPRRRSRSRSRERHQRKRSKTRDRMKNGRIKNGTLNSSAVQIAKLKSEIVDWEYNRKYRVNVHSENKSDNVPKEEMVEKFAKITKENTFHAKVQLATPKLDKVTIKTEKMPRLS